MNSEADFSISNLEPPQRERLVQFTGPFGDALRANAGGNETIVLTDYLPPPGDELRASGLCALAIVELEHRWTLGEQPLLDEYVSRYPKLGASQTVVFELICEEYRIRHQHGDRPPLSHYETRFPTQFKQLEQWVNENKKTSEIAQAPPACDPVEKPVEPPRPGAEDNSATLQPASTLPPPAIPLDETTLPEGSSGESPRPEQPPIDMRATPPPIDDPTTTISEPSATVPLDSSEELPASPSPAATKPDCDQPTRLPDSSSTDAPPPAGSTADNVSRETSGENDSHKTLSVEGRYQLIKKIGSGNFGEVWLAEAPGGVEVAVKAIMRPIGSRLAQQELSALEVMKSLRHAFLLQVQAYWLDGDRLMIVMELADRSLLDRLEERREQGEIGVPLDELLTYFSESADALDYLHGEKVLHRDIKPANILLLREHAKVGDFGLARVLQDQRMQVTATSVGTPLYMAPEVWDKRIGPQSDQYSLAATYVELRLDRPLFMGDSMGELINAHLRMTPDLDPLPKPEQEVLIKALSKKPEDRYETCVQFVEALDAAARPKSTTIVEVPAKRARIVAIVTLLIAIPLIAWLLLRGSGEPPLPEIVLPSGCEAAEGAELLSIGDRRYYNRIERLLADGHRVAFRLMPSLRTDDPKPFYIMENMVSNRVFRQFAEAHPEVVEKSEWELGAIVKQQDAGVTNPDLPAFRMSVVEAHHCAVWLGGLLPTTAQWDKAAGRHPDDHGELLGPYKLPWNDKDPNQTEVAITIAEDQQRGPMPVGTATGDVSPFGIRDMAGNGQEFTREVNVAEPTTKTVPLKETFVDPYVIFRSASYTAEKPLTYEQIEVEPMVAPYYYPVSPSGLYTDAEIGFRVVIELGP